jgi:hypothetical protein
MTAVSATSSTKALFKQQVAFVLWIAVSLVAPPFTHPFFPFFTQALDRSFVMPSRTKLNNILTCIFAVLMMMMTETIRLHRSFYENMPFLGGSVDMYTAKYGGEGFAAVDIVFNDKDFVRRRFCVGVKHVPGSHTADFIATMLTTLFLNVFACSISLLVMLMTVDQGANVWKSILLLNLPVLACNCHVLQSVEINPLDFYLIISMFIATSLSLSLLLLLLLLLLFRCCL